jgi:hypothetical protein
MAWLGVICLVNQLKSPLHLVYGKTMDTLSQWVYANSLVGRPSRDQHRRAPLPCEALDPTDKPPHGGAGAGVQARDGNPSTVPRAAAGASSWRPRRPGAAAVGAARCGDQPPALRLPRVGLPPPPLPLRLPHHLSNQCVPSFMLDFLSPIFMGWLSRVLWIVFFLRGSYSWIYTRSFIRTQSHAKLYSSCQFGSVKVVYIFPAFYE